MLIYEYNERFGHLEYEQKINEIFELVNFHRKNLIGALANYINNMFQDADDPENTDAFYSGFLIKEFGEDFFYEFSDLVSVMDVAENTKTRKQLRQAVYDFAGRGDNFNQDLAQQFYQQKFVPESIQTYIRDMKYMKREPFDVFWENIGINFLWNYLGQLTMVDNDIEKGWNKMNYSRHSYKFFKNFRMLDFVAAEYDNDDLNNLKNLQFNTTWSNLLNHSQILATNGQNFNSILKVIKYWTHVQNEIFFRIRPETFHFLKLMSPDCVYTVTKLRTTRQGQTVQKKIIKIKQQYHKNMMSFDFLSLLMMTFQKNRSKFLQEFIKDIEHEALFNENECRLMNNLYTVADYQVDLFREGIAANSSFTRHINIKLTEKHKMRSTFTDDDALEDENLKTISMPYMPGCKTIRKRIKQIAEQYYSNKGKQLSNRLDQMGPHSIYRATLDNPEQWFQYLKDKSDEQQDLEDTLQNKFIIFDSSFANIQQKNFFFKETFPIFQINTKAYQSDHSNHFYNRTVEAQEFIENEELSLVLKKFHLQNYDKYFQDDRNIIFFYQIVIKVPIFSSVAVINGKTQSLGLECLGFNYFTINVHSDSFKGHKNLNILGKVMDWIRTSDIEGYDPDNSFDNGEPVENQDLTGKPKFDNQTWSVDSKKMNWHESILVSVSTNHVKDQTLTNLMADFGMKLLFSSPFKTQTRNVLYDTVFKQVETVIQNNYGVGCGFLVQLFISFQIMGAKQNILQDIIQSIVKFDLSSKKDFYEKMTETQLAQSILEMLIKTKSKKVVMLFYATTKDYKGRSNYVIIDVIQKPNYSRLLKETNPQNYEAHPIILEFNKNCMLKASFFKFIDFFVAVENDHFYVCNEIMTKSFLQYTNQYSIQNSRRYLDKILKNQSKERPFKQLNENEKNKLQKLEEQTFMRCKIAGQVEPVSAHQTYRYEQKFEEKVSQAVDTDFIKGIEAFLNDDEQFQSSLHDLNDRMQAKYLDMKYARRQFPEGLLHNKKEYLKSSKATGQFDIETTSELGQYMIPFIICLNIDFPEMILDLSFKRISKKVSIKSRKVKECFQNDKANNVPCLGEFVFFLQKFSESIHQEIKDQFNFEIAADRELYISQYQLIKERIKIILYGWNSSGFDLPLIMPYLQFLDPQITPVIGDLGRIKFLNYDIYQFQDLFLTIGGSLKSACISFGIGADDKKMDLDISEYPTFVLLEAEKQKIIEYCFKDLDATRAVNIALVKEFNQIIPQIEEDLFEYLNIQDEDRRKQIKKINFNQIDLSYVPSTVSALSELLFQTQRGFFIHLMLAHNKKNKTDHYDWVYKGTNKYLQHSKEKKSYHGGLTFVANYSPLYNGFYVDMNSLYPSVIALDAKPTSYVQTVNCFQIQDYRRQGGVFTKEQINTFMNPGFYVSYYLYAVYEYKFRDNVFVTFCTKVENTNYQFRFFKASSVEDKDSYQQIWGIEILEALKQNALEYIIIGQKHIYKTHPPNKDLYGRIIRFFYEQRIEAKRKKQDAKQMLLKIIMNSSYGKKAQRNFENTFLMPHDQWVMFQRQQLLKSEGKMSKFFEQIQKLEIIQTSIDTNSGLLQLMGDIDRAQFFDENPGCKSGKKKLHTFKEFFETEQFTKKLDMKNPQIRVTMKEPEFKGTDMGSLTFLASFITAAARTRMSRAIHVCGGLKNVWYMDTDSLFVNEEGMDRLKNSGLVDDTKMGHLKNELGGDKAFYKFQAFSPKCYILRYKKKEDGPWCYKTAFKGVKKPKNQDFHSPLIFKNLKQNGFSYQSEKDRNVFQKVNLGSIKNCGRSLFSIPKAKSFIKLEGQIQFFMDEKDLKHAGMIIRQKISKRDFESLEHSQYLFEQGSAEVYDAQFNKIKDTVINNEKQQ